MPLEPAAASAANELAGERVPVLVSGIFLFDPFLPGPLFHQSTYRIKVLLRNDGGVMAFNIKLVAVAVVVMPLEAVVRVCLLEQTGPDVLLVHEHLPDRGAGPSAAFPGRDPEPIELFCDGVTCLPFQCPGEDPSHPPGFILIDGHLAIFHVVSKWGI